MLPFATLAWGIFAYLLMAASLVALAGFLLGVPLTGLGPVPPVAAGAAETGLGAALAIDVALLVLFGLQHSVMARPRFKRWWTRLVPEPIERSTYLVASVAALGLLLWQWRPLPATVWSFDGALGAVLTAGFVAGWVVLLYATFLLDHFHLFGLRQVARPLRGDAAEGARFRTPGLYRFVRHPIYVGWLMVFWLTPVMTLGHLLFALGMTAYVLIAIPLEERDLIEEFGAPYLDYRRRVPALVPGARGRVPAPITRMTLL